MLVYGKNVLEETDPKKIRRAYTSKKEYLNFLKKNNIRFDFVDNERLNQMVDKNHQGIILDVDEYDYYSYSDLKSDFIVALDHLSDPHNLGSIIRTCACAGVKEIIIPKDRSVRVNETVVKVSAGLVDDVKIIMVTNLAETIKKLKKENYFIYTSDMKGTSFKKVDYSGKKVLVLGNEGSGVSKLIKDNSDFLVKIDMVKDKNSLNVGVAAGILIYEMRDHE
jgi:23S rRNA (guanosine2251-2'-O)-methyltransferase